MPKFILLIMLVSLILVSPVSMADTADSQNCASCHGLEFAQWRLSPHSRAHDTVTCTTCHNEHAGEGPAGLRLPKDELCASCHGEDPQYQLLTGTSPFEYQTENYATVRATNHNTEDSCVTCHMAVTAGRITVGGHTMLMVDSSGKKNTAACLSCHGEIADFNLNARQQEVAERLSWLNEYLPAEPTQARQVYQFIKDDNSLGVHNPKYAIKLLADANESVGAPEWISRPEAELPQEDDVCSSCKW